MVSMTLPGRTLSNDHEVVDQGNGVWVESADVYEAIPTHPLGVKPSGNAFTASKNLRWAIGTFGILPDELIHTILELLDQESLTKIGQSCKALYAFTRSEELWKALFVQSPPKNFSWQGTWRSTLLNIPSSQEAQIDCSDLFSDILHRPFYCAHISLTPYIRNIPARNEIARLPNLSPEEFEAEWTDKPFVLTEPVRSWPVYKDWSTESLLEKYGDKVFRAEAVDWPLSTYIAYMKSNADESPLYLFDRAFVQNMDIEVGADGAYNPPTCFGEDFFSLLRAQRPDHRWLIVGPERSGSTFHKDPNATSAWNAVLRGSKYWIMFPNSPTSPPPPGVYVSEDQSEVTSPLSIAEWLLAFHAEARRTNGCLEGICNEGEVLHVPSGWWHLVVNITDAIAITQNFVPKHHLVAALDFLQNKADQISGFRNDVSDPYSLFVERLQQEHPQPLAEAMAQLQARQKKKKRKWDAVVHDEEEEASGAGFSFGFGNDDSEEEVP